MIKWRGFLVKGAASKQTQGSIESRRTVNQLQVGEEDVNIEQFNPDAYIKKWFELIVRQFKGAKIHNNYTNIIKFAA